MNNPLKFIDPNGLRWAQRFASNGDTEYRWFATEDEYWAAVDQNSATWEGWQAVTFDESQPYYYSVRSRNGDELREGYVLNPDGTHGYVDSDCIHCGGVTTDWNTQLLIGSLIHGAFGLTNWGLEVGSASLAARQAAVAGEGFVTGLYGRVSVSTLEEAAASGGPTVEVVTNLTQAPVAGRALSVATGEGADTLANAAGAARGAGQLYRASIPKALLDQLKRSGLAIESTTKMGQGAAATTATELRILPQASRFVTEFFKQQ